MAREKPDSVIIIKFKDKAPDISIKDFEKLTPSLMDKAFDQCFTQYNRLRAQAVNAHNRKEKRLQKSIDAQKKPENHEEPVNG